MCASPKLDATRLIASVADRVKTISSCEAALTNRSHGFSGRLIRLGRSVGEIVQAAMHIRVLVLIGVRQAIYDLPRLLS